MQTTNVTVHVLRLKPGEDLKDEIEVYVAREKIEAGWMLTCVGSLLEANLRFANQPRGTKLHGPFEIVSLVGTVSCNGCHLHLSISDGNGQTVGGHLLSGSLIYTTAELVMGQSSDLVFTRENDGTTGWNELQVRNKDL